MSDAKIYFKRIGVYNAAIEAKLEEIATLEAMVTRITPVLKDTPGGSGDSGRKLENAIVKIVELKEQLAIMIDSYVDLKGKAMDQLDGLDSAEQYKILYKRYFECKNWTEIADEMDMSVRNVCYLHGKALQMVDGIIKQIGDEI